MLANSTPALIGSWNDRLLRADHVVHPPAQGPNPLRSEIGRVVVNIRSWDILVSKLGVRLI